MSLLAHFFRGREGGDKPPLWLCLVLAGSNFTISYAIIYWAETLVPSGLVSLIWAVFPIFIALGAHNFIPGERLTPMKIAGSVVAFGGVALLFHGDLANLGARSRLAALVVLLSPAVSSVGTLLVKRHGKGVSSLLLNRNALLLSAPALATLAIMAESPGDSTWSPRAVLATLYLALVGTTLTFAIWFWLLRHAPATALSTISYITPALAVLLGHWRNEPISLATLPPGLAILAGVAMVAYPARRPVPTVKPAS